MRISDDSIRLEFMNMKLKDILKMRLVNKRYDNIISDDKFWCKMLKLNYNIDKTSNCEDYYKDEYITNNNNFLIHLRYIDSEFPIKTRLFIIYYMECILSKILDKIDYDYIMDEDIIFEIHNNKMLSKRITSVREDIKLVKFNVLDRYKKMQINKGRLYLSLNKMYNNFHKLDSIETYLNRFLTDLYTIISNNITNYDNIENDMMLLLGSSFFNRKCIEHSLNRKTNINLDINSQDKDVVKY